MFHKFRTVTAAGVSAVALVSLGGGTAQAKTSSATAAAADKWIYLSTLKCNDTEDWGQDELKIEVNGREVLTEFMDPGDKITIHQYVHFSGSATVKLVDIDSPDPDDVLGKHTVRRGSGTMKFTNGADYELKYKVGHP
ncbi:hypothetical protein ABZ915_22690 [Streptomyces sp. NPDC046915]|uniref:hypothetical protein n=1 Tax=Streptomyces sp. NPDC046915 TaxID=3155257 RepID=UPI0033D44A39